MQQTKTPIKRAVESVASLAQALSFSSRRSEKTFFEAYTMGDGVNDFFLHLRTCPATSLHMVAVRVRCPYPLWLSPWRPLRRGDDWLRRPLAFRGRCSMRRGETKTNCDAQEVKICVVMTKATIDLPLKRRTTELGDADGMGEDGDECSAVESPCRHVRLCHFPDDGKWRGMLLRVSP